MIRKESINVLQASARKLALKATEIQHTRFWIMASRRPALILTSYIFTQYSPPQFHSPPLLRTAQAQAAYVP